MKLDETLGNVNVARANNYSSFLFNVWVPWTSVWLVSETMSIAEHGHKPISAGKYGRQYPAAIFTIRFNSAFSSSPFLLNSYVPLSKKKKTYVAQMAPQMV